MLTMRHKIQSVLLAAALAGIPLAVGCAAEVNEGSGEPVYVQESGGGESGGTTVASDSDHPHGGPPGQTGEHPEHPLGGPPGQTGTAPGQQQQADGDHDRGHGNDADGEDEDNPGRGGRH